MCSVDGWNVSVNISFHISALNSVYLILINYLVKHLKLFIFKEEGLLLYNKLYSLLNQESEKEYLHTFCC